jgi:hypothetical protein
LSWDQTFFDPIPLPEGKPLITLRDAVLYITKYPKQNTLHRRLVAMQALIPHRTIFAHVAGFCLVCTFVKSLRN